MGVCIETSCQFLGQKLKNVTPVWVCVLKLTLQQGKEVVVASHPVWVCVLKQAVICRSTEYNIVTPCMGVCIETYK